MINLLKRLLVLFICTPIGFYLLVGAPRELTPIDGAKVAIGSLLLLISSGAMFSAVVTMIKEDI